MLCGTPPSSSITQSALPAVSDLVASKRNFFAVEPTGLMVKFMVPELPPPGVVLKTVIAAVPAVATNAAPTGAVNCVLLIKVVVKATPFHLMTELFIKFVPLAVTVNAAAPAVTETGKMDNKEGTGLLPMGVMVKAAELLTPPPGAGVTTVTGTVPAAATREALTEAVNCNEFT